MAKVWPIIFFGDFGEKLPDLGRPGAGDRRDEGLQNQRPALILHRHAEDAAWELLANHVEDANQLGRIIGEIGCSQLGEPLVGVSQLWQSLETVGDGYFERIVGRILAELFDAVARSRRLSLASSGRETLPWRASSMSAIRAPRMA